MAQRKAHEVESFLGRPEGAFPIVLVYGPNGGLVAERARRLAKSAVDDPDDAFQLIRLDGDEIASDPMRLADEVNTLGLFGGRRCIWVRAGSRNLGPALTPLMATPPVDCVVVIQAGDLANKNPLRTAVEACRHGMALPCYADDPRDLATLLEQTLRKADLGIARDAREAMVGYLGADRALSLREIEKLALYAQGAGTVTLQHVEAVMADASAIALDTVIDAAFSGQGQEMDAALQKVLAQGDDAGMIAAAALRHACTLHKARLSVDRGASPDSAAQAARVFFKRKQAFTRQLASWPAASLEGIIDLLREAQGNTRKQARLGEAHLSRALLQIASRARR